jgi:hypothetical protein
MTDQPIGASASSGNRRFRTMVLAGSGVVVVLAAVGFLLFRGGDGADEPAIPVLPAQAADETESADETTEQPLALPTVTYDIYLDRDPFEPVLQEAEAVPEPDEATGEPPPPPATGGTIVVDPDTGQLIVVPPTSPTPNDPALPAQPGSPTQPGSSSPPGEPSPPSTPTDPHPKEQRRCRGEAEMVCEGRVVSLVGVQQTAAGPQATFQVDTTTYEVVVGQDFATSFRLLSVDGDCATFLYGDERNTLCVGQRVLK